DDFFARQPHARDQPQDRRVKPQHRLHDLFNDNPDPIPPAHMKELMTEDDLLNLIGLGADHLRKQNDGAAESEGHRLTTRDISNLGSHANEILCLIMEEAWRSD